MGIEHIANKKRRCYHASDRFLPMNLNWLTIVVVVAVASATLFCILKFRKQTLEIIGIVLEIVIIFLIVLELRDARQQSKILESLDASSSATAQAMKTLVQDQKDSLGTQQASLAKIEEMNAVVAQQLKLLKKEQEERIAQANSRPVLELWAENYDEAQKRQSPVLLEKLGETRPGGSPTVRLVIQYWIDRTHAYSRFILRNVGNATALNVTITPRLPPDITVRCIEFPWLKLVPLTGYAECQAPHDTIPPIPPRPKDEPQNPVVENAFDTTV